MKYFFYLSCHVENLSPQAAAFLDLFLALSLKLAKSSKIDHRVKFIQILALCFTDNLIENNSSLQECIYETFRRSDCVIRMSPDDPLTEQEICFIVVGAYHGKRHSAILKLSLIMVKA